MNEVNVDPSKTNTEAITKVRLETVLQEARKDEAKLKNALEMKRLRRRLRAS